MKICIVASGLKYPSAMGGIRHQFDLARALARRSCEVHLVQSISKMELRKVYAHYVKPLNVFHIKSINMLFRSLVSISHLHKKYNFDVIHDRGYFLGGAGVIASQIIKIPCVFQIDYNFLVANESKKSILRKMRLTLSSIWLKYIILRKANAIMVVSESLKRILISSCNVPADKIFVLPNAVDIDRFNPSISGESVRKAYGINNKLVVFTGAIVPTQDLECLIKSASVVVKKIPNIKFLIVGGVISRIYYEKLKRLVKRLKLSSNIVFTGRKRFNEIPKIVSAADITVALYKKNSQFGFSPLKVFEYMAVGKPIVATKMPFITEILNDGETAILVDPGNHEQLAEAIITLLSNQELAKKIGKKGRMETQEKYSYDVATKRLLIVYENLIKSNSCIC